jgi:hypothetical protein
MKWEDYFKIVENISTRYFYIAGIAFLLGYVLLRKWMAGKKIQPKFPKLNDYVREVSYSIITMLMFAFVPFFLIKNPDTLYNSLHQDRRVWMVLFFCCFPFNVHHP